MKKCAIFCHVFWSRFTPNQKNNVVSKSLEQKCGGRRIDIRGGGEDKHFSLRFCRPYYDVTISKQLAFRDPEGQTCQIFVL